MNSLYLKYNHLNSVDQNKLDQLISLGKDIDEDVLGELIGVHSDTSIQIILDLKQFYKELNYSEIKRCVHKFKSSSANLGLNKLHQLCADLETYLTKNSALEVFDHDLILNYIETINYEFEQTQTKLSVYQKAKAA